jgi:3-oxoacyl-[acyl-carrier-protein] synthase-3
MTNVGILGVGVYLPEVVVKNDSWPESIVRQWAERQSELSAKPPREPTYPMTDGMKKVMASLGALRDDPFRGSRERRRMPDGMLSSEMEAAAGKIALSKAGVDPKEIDLLLVFSTLPDYLTTPNAPAVHHALGLPRSCLTVQTENACNTFLAQLCLAEQLIAGGQAKRALLVQSAALRRKVRTEDEFSPWFGDAATAVVLGPVPADIGLVGRAHYTDGSYHRALVTGCPGKRWWEGSELIVYAENAGLAFRMILEVCDMGRDVVGRALSQAGLRPEDVNFYAAHQPAPWFAELTRREIGLSAAKTMETFSWAGNLASSNIPLCLSIAQDENLIKRGDVVAMYSMASGLTASGAVLRWGRN